MVVEIIREPDFHAFIAGTPRPQGSKNNLGRGRMVESSKYVKQWRLDIAAIAAAVYKSEPLDGQLTIDLAFVMPRPKAMSARKPTPPHTHPPDLDKLFRAVGDALKGIVYRDDAQIVTARVAKRIAQPGETAGVSINVWQGGIPYA